MLIFGNVINKLTTPLLLVLLLLLPVLAWSDDLASVQQHNYMSETAYFADASGKLDLPAARQQVYTPYTGLLQRRLGTSVLWLRVTIAARAMPQSMPFGFLALRVSPPVIEDLALYDPLQSGGAVAALEDGTLTGSGGYHHSFRLPLSSTPRYVWLRIHTVQASLIRVEVMPEAVLRHQSREELRRNGVIILFAILCLVLGINLWCHDFEALTGVFVLKQLVLILVCLYAFGYSHFLFGDLVPRQVLDTSFTALMLLLPASSALFFYYFFRLYSPPNSLLAIPVIMTSLLPVELALWASGRLDFAFKMSLLSLILGPGLQFFIVTSYTIWHRARRPLQVTLSLPWLCGTYSVLLGIQIIGFLSPLVTGHTQHTLYEIFLPCTLVNCVMVLGVLKLRAMRVGFFHATLLDQIAVAQHVAVLERREREEQGDFLVTMAHEIKSPLSVLSLFLERTTVSPSARERAQKSVQDINNTIDRCAQLERAQPAETTQAVRQQGNFIALLQQLQWDSDTPWRIQLTLQPGLGPWMVDVNVVRIILVNLLGNALKYAPPQSDVLIAVAAEARAGRAGLAIRFQNPPGSAGRPDPAALFKKYYRSAGAGQFGGTGLGLYLAHRLALSLDGALEYEPDPAFVTFVLWLPQ